MAGAPGANPVKQYGIVSLLEQIRINIPRLADSSCGQQPFFAPEADDPKIRFAAFVEVPIREIGDLDQAHKDAPTGRSPAMARRRTVSGLQHSRAAASWRVRTSVILVDSIRIFRERSSQKDVS